MLRVRRYMAYSLIAARPRSLYVEGLAITICHRASEASELAIGHLPLERA